MTFEEARDRVMERSAAVAGSSVQSMLAQRDEVGHSMRNVTVQPDAVARQLLGDLVPLAELDGLLDAVQASAMNSMMVLVHGGVLVPEEQAQSVWASLFFMNAQNVALGLLMGRSS